MLNAGNSPVRKFFPLIGLGLVCLALIVWGNRRMNVAADQLDRLQRQIQFSKTGSIEPSAAVLESLNTANERLEKLHTDLDVHLFVENDREKFLGDSTAAYFELASFIETLNQNLQSQGITIAEGERFGFSQFEQEGPASGILNAVMNQKQAVAVIMTALLDAKPNSLTYLKREAVIEAVEDSTVLQQAAGNAASGRTQYEDTIIGEEKNEDFESYTFELQFEGYSESLRRFLKGLTTSSLPVLVKQLRVDPLARYEEPESAERPSGSANPFDLLASIDESADSGAPIPIIRSNLSSFQLRLEVFIGQEALGDS